MKHDCFQGYVKTVGRRVPGFVDKEPSWKERLATTAQEMLELKFVHDALYQSLAVDFATAAGGVPVIAEAVKYDAIWGIGVDISDPEILSKKQQWGLNILGAAHQALIAEVKRCLLAGIDPAAPTSHFQTRIGHRRSLAGTR